MKRGPSRGFRTRFRRSRPKAAGKGDRPETLNFWLQLLAALVVVAGVAVAAILAAVHWTGEELDSSGSGLEVVVATTENHPAESVLGGFLQSRASTPQVDLTVRNTGDNSVVLTRARVTVEDSAWLPVCVVGGAGPVPIAGRYSLPLPFLPNEEERTVYKTLHDEVPAKGIDRLKIFFQAPQVGEDDSVYALHVELESEHTDDRVDAGRFLLGVPGPVARNGQLLPEDDYLLSTGGIYVDRAASTWCFKHNLSELRRVLSRPGQRSAEITALSQFQPAREWPRYSHANPARASLAPLMNDPNILYGPMVAVYAATRTGDAQLIQQMRRRAAGVLVKRAERSLKPDVELPMAAIEQAHASINLAPSTAARAVLARAEARVWEIEEDQEEASLGS